MALQPEQQHSQQVSPRGEQPQQKPQQLVPRREQSQRSPQQPKGELSRRSPLQATDEQSPHSPQSPTDERPHRPAPSKRTFQKETFRWDGVDVQQYKLHQGEHPGEGWREITRQVLAGSYGEDCSFRVRYFEVGPGGHSSLEKHEHVHIVINLRGRGQVIVGESVHNVEPFDLIYVPAWTPHQFVNDNDEPYGFLCIVDGDRDRPQPLSEEQLLQLQANPEAAAVMRLFTS